MGVTVNNGNLSEMTYNGQEVSEWIHNGVSVFTASKPWYAYKLSGYSAVITPPAASPGNYSITADGGYSYYQLNVQPYNSGSIETKNVDGTKYIPTNGCKNLHFNILLTYQANGNKGVFVYGKKKDGTTESILIQTMPTYSQNNNSYYKTYDVDVKGYESVYVMIKTTALPSGQDILWLGNVWFD